NRRRHYPLFWRRFHPADDRLGHSCCRERRERLPRPLALSIFVVGDASHERPRFAAIADDTLDDRVGFEVEGESPRCSGKRLAQARVSAYALAAGDRTQVQSRAAFKSEEYRHCERITQIGVIRLV
ncbi:unnamed protein product, partial [Nesidiocoris tenuis]